MTSLGIELNAIHALVSARLPFIERIVVASYDPALEALSTFVSSDKQPTPLRRDPVNLAQYPSLAAMAVSQECRVENGINRGTAAPLGSSYTCPIFEDAELAGFLFFETDQPDAFTPDAIAMVEGYAKLITQIFLLRMRLLHSATGVTQMAVRLARIRDLETGRHLERVAGYSRIMAHALSKKHGLDDEFVRYIELFSPLHDIGKVGIPDSVLLKPDSLNMQELQVMRSHVQIGEKIIEKMTSGMGLQGTLAARVMYNIVATHHERGDGSGYPRGVTANAIPIEGSIVAVADVFDALSNRRPYKRPWSEEEVVQELLKEVERGRLNADCVNALLDASEQRNAVRAQWSDAQPG